MFGAFIYMYKLALSAGRKNSSSYLSSEVK